MPKADVVYVVPSDCLKILNASLKEESDRALVIVATAWIDWFLEVKLRNEFAQGNKKVRESLFSNNGPFSTFSAKLNTAFCAGWIDADVYHDATVIRKLRNEFAHAVDAVSLNDDKTRKEVEALRVPHRQYYDWGKLQATRTASGVALYNGEKPEDSDEDLNVPGTFTFRLAIAVVVSVLVSNLGLLFATDKEGYLAKPKIPKYMENIEQASPSDRHQATEGGEEA